MATTHPRELPGHIRRDPFRAAECKVYDRLTAQLDDSFRLYYSRPWLGLNDDGSEVEGEADFVVAHADLGFLVIEVKGGRISHDGAADKWYSTDRFDVRQRIKNPVDQASRSKHRFLKELKKRKELNDIWIGAFAGVVFPDCKRPHYPLGIEMPQEILAFTEDMESLAAWAKQRMKANEQQTASGSLGVQGLRVLNELLARDFELESPLLAAVADEEREITVLTGQQYRLLEALRNHRRCAIKGGAGTGKTLLACRKAEQLADGGLSTLLVCFNRPLAEYLTSRLAPVDDLQIGSFHSVCLRLSEAAGLTVEEEPTEPGFFERILPDALVAAVAAEPSLKFDAVIVDEAQDFQEEWWSALELVLRDDQAGILYAFFDDNQTLYSTTGSAPKMLFGEPLVLTENLRNTRTIHMETQRFYRGVTHLCLGPRGRPVDLRAVGYGDDPQQHVLQVLAELTRKEQLKEGQIAVLLGSAGTARALSRRLATKYDIGDAAEVASGCLLVDSVRRFKGLERPVVVLTDLAPLVDNPELAYVALSRARTHLVALGTNDELGVVFGQA